MGCLFKVLPTAVQLPGRKHPDPIQIVVSLCGVTGGRTQYGGLSNFPIGARLFSGELRIQSSSDRNPRLSKLSRNQIFSHIPIRKDRLLPTILHRARESNLGILLKRRVQVYMRDSDRRAVSSRQGKELALAVGSEQQASSDVFKCEIGKVAQYFLLRHARGEIFKHVRHCNSQTPDARLSTPLPRFYRDPSFIIHENRVRF
jgi:hypothetical protein